MTLEEFERLLYGCSQPKNVEVFIEMGGLIYPIREICSEYTFANHMAPNEFKRRMLVRLKPGIEK